jgi:glutamate-1-semialdehyde 2,1-aminomutase
MTKLSPVQDPADEFDESRRYRDRALKHLAFGVSSTPRAIQLPVPLAIESAEGVSLTDLDGNKYIDFALGYGPLILGHSPKEVIAAVQKEMSKGLRTASIHTGEAALADLIAECVPSAEITSFVSTGTEAVQLAIRIARAATGRVKIIKFRANYHGWFDNINVANSADNDGPATVGQDPHAADAVTILDWGDLEGLKQVLTRDFAAVLLEPVAINAGCFSPPPDFLAGLRKLTSQLGVVLIFDEVISGFRHALGGAQELYRVTPDITVLGKAMGAGLPISAVSGNRSVMAPIASGKLQHRGTFNGNPLSVAASIACINFLRERAAEIYPRMSGFAADLHRHVNIEAERLQLPVCANQAGAALQLFAGARSVATLKELGRVDKGMTLTLTAALLREGIYMLPRGLMYISAVHTAEHIAVAKLAINRALQRLGQTKT